MPTPWYAAPATATPAEAGQRRLDAGGPQQVVHTVLRERVVEAHDEPRRRAVRRRP